MPTGSDCAGIPGSQPLPMAGAAPLMLSLLRHHGREPHLWPDVHHRRPAEACPAAMVVVNEGRARKLCRRTGRPRHERVMVGWNRCASRRSSLVSSPIRRSGPWARPRNRTSIVCLRLGATRRPRGHPARYEQRSGGHRRTSSPRACRPGAGNPRLRGAAAQRARREARTRKSDR